MWRTGQGVRAVPLTTLLGLSQSPRGFLLDSPLLFVFSVSQKVSPLHLPFLDLTLSSFFPSSSYLLSLFPQQEGVAPHPYAPAEAISTPSEPLQGHLSSSGPAALTTRLLQAEKGASAGPFWIPRLDFKFRSSPTASPGLLPYPPPASCQPCPHQTRQAPEQVVEEGGLP